MSERLKYERFFWFHEQIKAGKYPNAQHLAEEFEITGRTAQRDIEFMRDRFNAPLEYDFRRRGYRYADDSFEIPGHWISETNILSLAFSVRLASTIPDPALKDDLCRLIDRVTGATGKKGTSCLNRLTEKISVKNIEYARVDTEIFRQVAEALFDDRALHITYHSPHTADTSTRTIQPLHLMHYMGSWHLLAWCTHRQEIRDFAVARIRKITPAKETIRLPEDLPPIKDYTRRHFGIMQGDEATEVILRFSPKIAPWITEQIWHPRQQTGTDPDGSLLLTFPAADFRELVKIILSHGAEVQVVEPPELRMLVQQEIDRMTKIYCHYDIA
jgi:predicted DNA-binding transcriptional regulator YafY